MEKYIESAKKHGQATLNGNYKVGNKEAKKLKTTYKQFEEDIELAIEVLSILVNADILITIDPIGSNLFAYCRNNSINYFDPSGYMDMHEDSMGYSGISYLYLDQEVVDAISSASFKQGHIPDVIYNQITKINNGLENGVNEVIKSYAGEDGIKQGISKAGTARAVYVTTKKVKKEAIEAAALKTGNLIIIKNQNKISSKIATTFGLQAAWKSVATAIAFIPDAITFGYGFYEGYKGEEDLDE